MSKRDERDLEIAKRQLAVQFSPGVARLNVMLEKGLAFHEWIWSDDEKITAERRLYLEMNPAEFRARFASFNVLAKIMASRVANSPGTNAASKMTPEKLAALGLTAEQIEKIAGLDDD